VIRGDVRVSMPPMQDETLHAMLSRFAEKNPEVRLLVDFSTRFVDLLREGYDVAFRATGQIEPGLVARVVAQHRVLAVASPTYVAKHGAPRTVRELRKHRCLTGFARGELPQSSWPVGRGTVHVESAFSSNDIRLLREVAIQGGGIALLPELIIHEDICSGRLVQVLEGTVESHNRLAIVFAEREFMAPQVRAFIDALVEWARTSPYVAPPRRRAARPSRASK
jgi:DNA-binding transcriptional LysR family regulator